MSKYFQDNHNNNNSSNNGNSNKQENGKGFLLSLTRDPVFKMFFQKRLKFLKSLMQSFLPLPEGSVIEDVYLLNTEVSPEKTSQLRLDKSFILDLRVKLKRRINNVLQDTEIVNVEVQTTSQGHFMDRILAYSSRLYSQQLKEGEAFKKLIPVYSLVFTTLNLNEFKAVKNEYCHICNIRRVGFPDVIMSRGMCFVFVELSKFSCDMDKLFDKKSHWCYLLKNSNQMNQEEYLRFKDKGGIMAEAVKHLWTLSQDESIQEILMMKERDKKDQMAREEYVREEAMEKGMKRGIRKGRAEGMELVAQNMLKENFDISLISKMTGLSPDHILKLKK